MQNAIQEQDLQAEEMTQQEAHDHPLPESTPIRTVEEPQSDFKEPTAPEPQPQNQRSEKRITIAEICLKTIEKAKLSIPT